MDAFVLQQLKNSVNLNFVGQNYGVGENIYSWSIFEWKTEIFDISKEVSN